MDDDVTFDESFRWNSSHHFNMGSEHFGEDENPKTRKRLRSSGMQVEDAAEDDGPAPTVSTKKAIRVEEDKEIWAFYEQRFKNCQQTACKLIAKAWIKLVEPKKQSTHPYTGKDEKAPDWWPEPWGSSKEDKVRHKEPDHLYKRGMHHPIVNETEGSRYSRDFLRACVSPLPYPENDRGAERASTQGYSETQLECQQIRGMHLRCPFLLFH
jgi:hypothetical protein